MGRLIDLKADLGATTRHAIATRRNTCGKPTTDNSVDATVIHDRFLLECPLARAHEGRDGPRVQLAAQVHTRQAAQSSLGLGLGLGARLLPRCMGWAW